MNPDSGKGKNLADMIELYIVTLSKFFSFKFGMPPHDIAATVVKYFLAGEEINDTKRSRQDYEKGYEAFCKRRNGRSRKAYKTSASKTPKRKLQKQNLKDKKCL